MCGIAGIVNFDPCRKVDRALLERMTDTLSHRGPDGRGFFADKNVGLGHRRLAIIDLSTGAQPMMTEDKHLVIVFNGEIYNYVELTAELKSLGHRFTTSSDTEVILEAYKEWGFDCQQKLNGMWAFAIWDVQQQHLFLSRDRLGEKPLHYSTRDNSLFFGSEIKSILASGLEYRQATHLFHLYLSLGYVPAPYTLYDGIQKLLPGHFLVLKGGRVKEATYWELPQLAEKDMRMDSAAIHREFQECFFDAVKIRMRSDVPYGAFLSGGLDSSSIVGAMSAATKSPVETFTIGFDEKAFDERRLARLVAGRFNTNHHEKIVMHDSFDESLRKVLHHFDEPFGDASAVLVGMVSRLARESVKMVLTGDGGDEVLSGYTSYLTEKLAANYRRLPSVVRKSFYHSVSAAAALSKDDLRYKLNRVRRFLDLSATPFEERFRSKLSMLDPVSIRQLIPPDMPQLWVEDYLSDVFSKCSFSDPFYRLMYFNLKVSLPDDMLAKVDRMSMAHGLESRVPFLDHRLVELMWGVDQAVKLPGRSRKDVLRKTWGKQLPLALRRAPKMSFCVPLREWFKRKEFDSRLKELEHSEFGLNGNVIGDIVRANTSSTEDYGDFLWRLFVLMGWNRKSRQN